MKILIIGVGHRVQEPKTGSDPCPVADRKDLLKRLVTKRVSEGRITFVGEETKFTDDAGTESIETIARQIAVSEGGLSWKNIHISKAAENALGISEEQESRGSISQEMHDGVVVYKERRLPSDAIREEYMVWRATTEAKKVNAANILILCGSIHAEEMAKRFLRDGHQVETDYLCQYA
jgi:hypothetical protein